jgi:hypothetical protein
MLEKLLNALLNKQSEIKDGLVETPAATLEEYRLRVGQIQGIQIAIDELTNLVRAGEREE